MEMALVGSIALRRLKQSTPLGSGMNKSQKILLLPRCYQELNDNDYDEKMSLQTDKRHIQSFLCPHIVMKQVIDE
jgi:hypothetical protein